jgi:UPF0271 protein
MYKVDINSDLGESFGAYTIGADHAVIAHVTSANVACGMHAGDPVVMENTVEAAKAAGASVGAHPGYPDIMGFGRRDMVLSPKEAKAYVKYQIGALLAFTQAAGVVMRHVKPHGALYNMAAVDGKLARAIAEAIAEVDGNLIFLGLAGSKMIDEGRACGLRTASEVFADRAYTDEGTLVPRSLPGSVIHDRDAAIGRVVGMVKSGTVASINGKEIGIRADSICVHGDNPNAVEFVRSVRDELTKNGIEVAALNSFIK